MSNTKKAKTEQAALETIDAEPIEPTDLEQEIDREQAEAELLADMPDLTDPKRLRIKHQNMLMRISLKAEPVFQDREQGDTKLSDEATEATLKIAEEIDEFAEAIAKHPDEYVEWSQGKPIEVFLAIFARYVRARGE